MTIVRNPFPWTFKVFFFISILILGLVCVPVGAAVQETTYLGRITALDPLSGTITIRAESQYLCDYSPGGGTCHFNPITPLQVVGAVPDEGIFNTFRKGDQVVATILGASGGAWAGFALVIPGPGNLQWIATEIFGDPHTIPVPLAGSYTLEYSTVPDCSRCSGSVCRAATARVVLKSEGTTVIERSMNAGQSARYSGRNDGSSVSILYLSGEAGAGPCSPGVSVTGIQPVSAFIIHVVPPIGQPVTQSVVVPPTAEVTEQKATPAATPPTTQSPSGYLIPAVALCIMAVGARRLFR